MLWAFEYNLVYYARADLPRIMPNLETLGISSAGEVLDTPIVSAKFLHLKLLEICLSVAEGSFPPAYDYLSLAFFLDACPVLETFKLSVCQTRMKLDPISGSLLRKMPGHHHASIKNVKIDGFCSAKSMIELTCHTRMLYGTMVHPNLRSTLLIFGHHFSRYVHGGNSLREMANRYAWCQ
ncbi:hypothetical protein ACQJBY_000556 [Aegilops geniculata]